MPVWPGLLGNTAVYTATRWATLGGLSALRRTRRRRRALCPTCGYAIHATPIGSPCPECGTAP
ncbi:MAG: hypothetical protein K2Q20_00840 [Phycisphaerales bacterium]|nr:hypothetical protein [Phycisphaerales bacterium]